MSKNNYFIGFLGLIFAYPLIFLALYGTALILNPFWAGFALFKFGLEFGFIIPVVYFFFLLKKIDIYFAKGFALGSILLILYHFIPLFSSFNLPSLLQIGIDFFYIFYK